MQKYQKLRNSSDFDSVKKYGAGFSDFNLIMLAMDQEAVRKYKGSRLGFIVSKRIGGATVRNKYKRRLKESANSISIIDGMDIVFIARNGILNSDYHGIATSMYKLLNNASLISTE
ncbi:MAG: ribonuclease P protein component [SAR202 cluster bacterium]|mgnify:CR=1 FL=1|nr:ribonuclease P protein component [SAR202 cluster bacterium]|tara:strand:- start:82257 stop:82604 length:348 start_codon:yes stop_codon:yes gene_type:complete